jgi:Xaa-Pro aminopeptidase
VTSNRTDCASRRKALVESLSGKAFIAYNYEHSDRATLRYLSGFTGEGTLILAGSHAVLLTDSRYTEQAKREVDGLRVQECRDWMAKDAAAELVALELETIAFAARRATYSWFDSLRKLGPFTLVDTPDPTNDVRAVKTQAEIESLRKAATLADSAFGELLSELRVGMNEADVALRLEWLMRTAGSEGVAFDANVSAGENTALNHYNPALGRRSLHRGDLLLFDFGACVDGYRSDITRTVSVGRPTKQAIAIYDLVLQANLAGIAAVAAGKTGIEVDAAARTVIADSGYGDKFGHGLGHGIGLEIHERPSLSTQSKDTLVAGMVTTVEPGIYIPGFGGVRIEDDVVVTETGCEVITSSPKDRLLEVGT